MLDLDGGGTIEEDELRVGLESIGKTPTDAELAEMLKQVDEDESGEIDLAEFIQFMYNLKITKSAASDKDVEIAKKDWDAKLREEKKKLQPKFAGAKVHPGEGEE